MPHKEAGRERSQLEETNCFMMGKEKEHRQHAHAWIDIEGDPTRKKSQLSYRNWRTNATPTMTYKRTRTEKIAEKGEQLATSGKNEKS